MSDVFVSYTREDEARVAAIVAGLESAGLSVWWDRAIPGGASWRQTIADRLDAARCVIVVWSAASAGPRGEFVHDEAGRAKARGVLLPVRIDAVSEPIGFGEVHSLDLVGWRGNSRDRRFRNLVAAAKALVAGGPRPRPVTPAQRARLLAGWSSGVALAVALLGFAADVAGLQAQLCRVPGARAICAARGLGGVPTAAEEALWTARPAGDCAGLQGYLTRFPGGAYAEEAKSRILAAQTVTEETWKPEEHPLALTVRAAFDPFAGEAAARADALTRATAEARTACAGFSTGGYRLISATARPQTWRCFPRGAGVACGFDGQAVCQVAARHVDRRQVCR
jgi:TIR domain